MLYSGVHCSLIYHYFSDSCFTCYSTCNPFLFFGIHAARVRSFHWFAPSFLLHGVIQDWNG